MTQPTFVLATRNPGKVTEFVELQTSFPHPLSALRLVSLGDFEQGLNPARLLQTSDEPHSTFMENAQAKALAISLQIPQALILADDSGLCVGALNNEPGVHSARYAGPQSNDQQNRQALRQKLSKVHLKTPTPAFFCATLALAYQGRIVACSTGILPGEVVSNEQGQNGFGYDSLFIPQGQSQTFAQMSSLQKNLLSHRTRAWQMLVIPSDLL